jgi:short-subunit dehydrogenase
LTEAIFYETANSGVTIHLVNPGPVDTEFFDAGVWQGKRPRRMASPFDVSRAIQRAILHNRMISTVPASRRLLVYAFHLIGPMGRWILRRRGKSS